MAHKGKIQLMLLIVAPPDQAEEGDRLFRTHAPWMEATHHRDGDKALLSYSVSKAPQLSNPMDPQLCPDREHLLHPERGLRDRGRCGRPHAAGGIQLAGLPRRG
jgi:hypothetical protein